MDRAFAWALELPAVPPRTVRPRHRRFAIGDPQAPLRTFLSILERNGLLGDDGLLAPDVMLVSMGDHFDWGTPEDLPAATDEALALLAWLAHHEWDQVILIAGNHDLGRVGELAGFDDETFVRAREQAQRVYRLGDENEERRFVERWPALPTSEVAARDFAAFRSQQRALTTHLLRQKRLRLAWAPDERHLFLHAGITQPMLDRLGIRGDARAIANGLNDQFDRAIDAWPGPPVPLAIPYLHRPGDAASGEGGGMLYHRAACGGWNERRFDPRTLPRDIVQIIGHVRDEKCRELLGAWCKEEPAIDGPIRHLVTDGERVEYARGLRELRPGEAVVLFLDGGMNHTRDLNRYELLEITEEGRLRPRAPALTRSA